MNVFEIYEEFKIFNNHWDNYTIAEKKILLKDFKRQLNELPTFKV